ncbi:unnamed protein product [Caenorhabditis angaria]|uniref:Uncharacterized protein n=1 Tax=Caenorhabditis angaria TaxID=860376 RepID=A0A9P1IE92_9PELO|nr:unnamed protein product [Caenorhabditis angaria]
MIKNPAELAKFIRNSPISGQEKSILQDYSNQGLIQYPFSPMNFLGSIQSLVGQVFGGFMRLPAFAQIFGPTDTRVAEVQTAAEKTKPKISASQE